MNYDPRAISREVKRNRIPINFLDEINSDCPKLNRWPFVKFKYDSKIAQKKANAKLINSRKGIDITPDEFHTLDSIIKKGTDENKSIYQIKIENNDSINKSITTLYRYINKGYLTTKRIDSLVQKFT